MKKAYIKRVKQILPLIGKKRKEVLANLNETFDSGLEQGSKQSALIYSRLGSPEEYVKDVCESFGIPARRIKILRTIRKLRFIPLIIAIIALIVFIWHGGLPGSINETFTVTSWETGESFEVSLNINRHLITRRWYGKIIYNGYEVESFPSHLNNIYWNHDSIFIRDVYLEETNESLWIQIDSRNGNLYYTVIASASDVISTGVPFVGPASTVEEALAIIVQGK